MSGWGGGVLCVCVCVDFCEVRSLMLLFSSVAG